MPLPFLFRAICFALIFFSIATDAQARWVTCHGCSSSAMRQLATNLPPERFSVVTVNVLEPSSALMRSYRVHVFYDYEFDRFFRFAVEVDPDAGAQREFSHWRQYQEVVDTLRDRVFDVSQPSAAVWLRVQQGPEVDISGSVPAFEQLRTSHSGMPTIVSSNLLDTFDVRLRFADGSTGDVSVSVGSAMHAALRNGSLRSPEDTPLPDDEQQLRHYDEIGDDVQTEYLGQHIQTLWENSQWLIRARDRLRYRVVCTVPTPDQPVCEVRASG